MKILICYAALSTIALAALIWYISLAEKLYRSVCNDSLWESVLYGNKRRP